MERSAAPRRASSLPALAPSFVRKQGPYEGVMFLYIFTTGCVTLRHIMPALLLRTFFAAVLIAVVCVPYWNFIGIM